MAIRKGAGGGEGLPAGVGGEFGFEKGLGGKILLRMNLARLPGKGGATSLHEDWRVVAPESDGLRATDHDNEGHVIPYAVEVRFGMAPPGKPEGFALCQSGRARRIKP